MPLADIRSISYLAEHEGDIGYLWVMCRGFRLNIYGTYLHGLLNAFQRGQVDFVQVWDEHRWPDVQAAPDSPMVHAIEQHRDD